MGHAESFSGKKSSIRQMIGRQGCTFAILAFFTLLPCISNMALAASIAAPPALCLLESGYGIIAAEVVESTNVNGADKGYEINDTHFLVDHVVVQPVTGKAFPLQQGGSLNLQISTGYGAQIEFNVATALSKENDITSSFTERTTEFLNSPKGRPS
jgi:hypothetical protein